MLFVVEVQLSGGSSLGVVKVEDDPVSNDQQDVEEVGNEQEVVRSLRKICTAAGRQTHA